MNKIIVIIPTYNESKNIEKIINIINGLDIKLDILVVDGNSSDKTPDIIRKLQAKMSNLNFLSQGPKMGLGNAYKKAFKWTLEKNYEKIIQMDADLSHDPKSIPKLISLSEVIKLLSKRK